MEYYNHPSYYVPNILNFFSGDIQNSNDDYYKNIREIFQSIINQNHQSFSFNSIEKNISILLSNLNKIPIIKMQYIKDLEDFRVFLLGKYIDERNYLISIESANATKINNKGNPINENTSIGVSEFKPTETYPKHIDVSPRLNEFLPRAISCVIKKHCYLFNDDLKNYYDNFVNTTLNFISFLEMNLILEFENLEKAFIVNSDKIEEYSEFIRFLTLHLEIKGKQKYYKSQKEKTLGEIQEKVEQKNKLNKTNSESIKQLLETKQIFLKLNKKIEEIKSIIRDKSISEEVYDEFKIFNNQISTNISIRTLFRYMYIAQKEEPDIARDLYDFSDKVGWISFVATKISQKNKILQKNNTLGKGYKELLNYLKINDKYWDWEEYSNIKSFVIALKEIK